MFNILQTRLIINRIQPVLDCGKYPVKRVVGEKVQVSAHLIADGHDRLAAQLRYKHESERKWRTAPMHFVGNEKVIGEFKVSKQGYYAYKVEGWIDHPMSWLSGTQRKLCDGQNISSELTEGAVFAEKLLPTISKEAQSWLGQVIKVWQDPKAYQEAVNYLQDPKLQHIFESNKLPELSNLSKDFQVYVDRKKALFSTWYEFFPRSASSTSGQHGTFKDCIQLLPRIANMGFDVLYFPPVHPIGEVNRKGKNNAENAEKGDVGSPWAIGSKYGGHKAIHPELGTIDDFKKLVQEAKKQNIEVAMDFALQMAPDHPLVKTHPEWFKWRPDGTIQYAENPPKKYQDIIPVYFETADWKNLWQEVLDTLLYWVEVVGIQIFRVDNPHTKPFYFWHWIIEEVKKKHPGVLFLAEAFTAPEIMAELGRQGFTQSYTYFTWRNSKHELVEYLSDLTQSSLKEYFRPNFWPNTPDILPFNLQSGNESLFMIRYFLAATLSSNTGVYGPVYEYMIKEAVSGKEEYLNSEKYEIRHWDWEHENKMTEIISQINLIRKTEASLQQTNNLVFCDIDNDQMLAYYKYDDDRNNETILICNLDSHNTQKATLRLPYEHMGTHPIKVQDLITGYTYWWENQWNYIELHPDLPFHIFRIERL